MSTTNNSCLNSIQGLLSVSGINIDYKGLLKYAKEKGVAPVDLSDEEKNMFIKNSDMKTINELREEIEA
ncbi:MAG: hypothetical protein IKR39_10475 [Lachnospiraceae bacterium]|nr:hypothetical protein [Lachnospiraceae bacterium]